MRLTKALYAALFVVISAGATFPQLTTVVHAQTTLLSQSTGSADQLYEQARQLYRNGQYENAITKFQQAQIAYQRAGNRLLEGYAFLNIGFSYSNIGNYNQSREYFERSLSIAQELGNQRLEGQALYGLAGESQQGNASQTIETYLRSIQLARQEGDKRTEAQALRLLAAAYQDQGNYAEAIRNFELSSRISGEIGDFREQGRVFNSIAALYEELGDNEEAIRSYQRAIEIARSIPDKSSEGGALLGLGNIYSSIGDTISASRFWNQALLIARETGDSELETILLRALGNLQPDVLIANARRDGNIKLEAYGWLSKGLDYQNNRNYRAALDAYQQSLTIYRNLEERDREGQLLAYIGRAWHRLNEDELGIIFLKESVNVREDLRSNIQTISSELDESYTNTVADDYRLLVDLLLEQERVLEAQRVLELLKIEELREFTRATYNTKGLQYDPIEQAVVDSHGSLIALGAEIYSCKPNCPQSLIDQQIALEGEYANQVRSFKENVRRNRGKDDVFYDPTTLSTDALDLVNAQPKTALIYPFVKDDDLWLLWVATGGVVGRVKVGTIANAEVDLSRAVLEFRQLLQKQDSDSLRQLKQKGEQLYNWLIKPLSAELEANDIQQLIFAQDRTTRYLPMAALHDGKQFLIERYTVSTVLSAALTDTADRLGPVDAADTLALGLQKGFPGYPALPNVREELDGVVKTDDEDQGVYPGQIFMDDAFNFDTLSQQVRHHRILHIATHAEFVPHVADASYILSGQGEQLTIAQLGSLGTQFNNLHLVVLSACQTALGGEALDGTEIAGVSSYFLGKNKAEAVMATLWKVDDEGTSVLMQRFYELMASGELTKAEALKHAQLSLLNNEANLTERFDQLGINRGGLVNPDAPDTESVSLSHPYYWAPFILIGNSL